MGNLVQSMQRTGAIALMTFALSGVSGCESVYYGAWEQLGVEKRDLLVDRVEDAMDAQEAAKEQFNSALEQFASVVGLEESNLKSMYDDLSDEYDDAVNRAEAVSDRISAVEDVSEDLFDEWRDELNEYSSDRLRSSSERQLQETEAGYTRLIDSMRKAEARMQPVLDVFQDQVLFLKHNLNAQAISSLRSELLAVETDVARLIQDMNDSINRSQAFIEDLEASS